MSLNATPSGERVHIGFFGMRNAGKSSLVNAVTGQKLCVVSDVKGTTTDPVKKAMELLPIGPVVIVDTPGIDDEGELGALRVEKAKEILDKVHIAILVTEGYEPSEAEKALKEAFEDKKLPYIIAYNKSDKRKTVRKPKENEIEVSALENRGITELKELIGSLVKNHGKQKQLLGDIISSDSTVVLVVPIDKAAPKGRLILPQQMVLRDILDKGARALVCRDTELEQTLSALKAKPELVVTDSQVFEYVSGLIESDIPLTSFSILMARYKGELSRLSDGAKALSRLKDSDIVLISEGCTHHRQCNDIGTVKLPAWIKNYSNADISFEFTSGGEFPSDLSKYALIVHCGGCMLTEKEMQSRLERAEKAGIPIVNYGMAIAQMNGILDRSMEIFK